MKRWIVGGNYFALLLKMYQLESERELLVIIFQIKMLTREIFLNRIKNYGLIGLEETSQELRMLSSVTRNCQVTMIVMKTGSQLSEMPTISHNFLSHATLLKGRLDPPLKLFSKCFCLCLFLFLVKCLKGHKSLRSPFDVKK